MNGPFDLIVIGGGVNGAGIARDAAGRGGKVLLLEAGDLARGTSSASTKLVHGGLRYLEYYEFALVREALLERERLWRIAPHIVRPMRFVLPVEPGMRPRWKLRAGLALYDALAIGGSLPGTRSIRFDRHPAGAPLKPGPVRGLEYSDCWVDDARLVVLTAKDAAKRGATILTRTRATAARREGGLWTVETSAGSFTGAALVNAGGPAADAVAQLAGTETAYHIRPVRGSHIVMSKLFDHPFAYIFQLPDTRICFAIPWEDDFTLIGTTDADHTGPLDHVHAGEAEIAYLCEAASRYFAKALKPSDVVWTYAGVRALVDDGSGRPEAATRGYRLPLSEPGEGAPLLGVYGGKITSHRHLAEEAVDKLAQRLPALASPAWTASEPLPGGDFPHDRQADLVADLQRDYAFLSQRDAQRIGRAYGTLARVWLGAAQVWDDLGRRFGAGLSEAEVEYLKAKEWAQTAEDVLWRRTKLGMHMSDAEQSALAEFMGG
ncbi:glycerol-3-phosphate dehydrogenase [Altererythrobacter salegens]|uniref:Glycerol-3-phosphate dehydrogenase n=1 Tax=Croceibacterium salegens TaxID=1737568 RepID=A0A6I4SZD0_9SPHN|nr:glycerol-3-phosphate dehydrogenase [Croceibacterium salegens]MXO60136.1 glycerol-3-phosphate dehydrogenase [Croceibacterium salegens]